MIASLYALLFAAALVGTALVVKRILPYDLGGGFVALVWLRLIPASYNIELSIGGGAEPVVRSYPGLAFIAIAGLGIVGLVLFGGITGRLTSEASGYV